MPWGEAINCRPGAGEASPGSCPEFLSRPTSRPVLSPAITTLQARQSDNEPFLRKYLGIRYSGLKALVSPAVHAPWPSRERRRSTGLSAKPHPNVVGPPQRSLVAIFALRSVGEPITMAAEKVLSGSGELAHPAPARDPINDTRADEEWTSTAEAAGPPDNRRRLLDILPFAVVRSDPMRQDQSIAISPEPDRGDPPAITGRFPAA